jgi:hypothetical protein
MTLQDGTTENLADCMLQLSQCRTLQEIYIKRLIFALYTAGIFSVLKGLICVYWTKIQESHKN